MPEKYQHNHPGQNEPRSYGETHHENRELDLTTAGEQDLAGLPMVGPQRARDLVQRRPFNSWADVAKVPGFSTGMIDDLKSGGAVIREGVTADRT
jgi:DNA uptake protein ComE-like DNA-binding protein